MRSVMHTTSLQETSASAGSLRELVPHDSIAYAVGPELALAIALVLAAALCTALTASAAIAGRDRRLNAVAAIALASGISLVAAGREAIGCVLLVAGAAIGVWCALLYVARSWASLRVQVDQLIGALRELREQARCQR